MGWNYLVLVIADLSGIRAEARFLGNQDFDRYKEKGAGNVEFVQKWLFEGVGPGVGGAQNAQQLPNNGSSLFPVGRGGLTGGG